MGLPLKGSRDVEQLERRTNESGRLVKWYSVSRPGVGSSQCFVLIRVAK